MQYHALPASKGHQRRRPGTARRSMMVSSGSIVSRRPKSARVGLLIRDDDPTAPVAQRPPTPRRRKGFGHLLASRPSRQSVHSRPPSRPQSSRQVTLGFSRAQMMKAKQMASESLNMTTRRPMSAFIPSQKLALCRPNTPILQRQLGWDDEFQASPMKPFEVANADHEEQSPHFQVLLVLKSSVKRLQDILIEEEGKSILPLDEKYLVDITSKDDDASDVGPMMNSLVELFDAWSAQICAGLGIAAGRITKGEVDNQSHIQSCESNLRRIFEGITSLQSEVMTAEKKSRESEETIRSCQATIDSLQQRLSIFGEVLQQAATERRELDHRLQSLYGVLGLTGKETLSEIADCLNDRPNQGGLRQANPANRQGVVVQRAEGEREDISERADDGGPATRCYECSFKEAVLTKEIGELKEQLEQTALETLGLRRELGAEKDKRAKLDQELAIAYRSHVDSADNFRLKDAISQAHNLGITNDRLRVQMERLQEERSSLVVKLGETDADLAVTHAALQKKCTQLEHTSIQLSDTTEVLQQSRAEAASYLKVLEGERAKTIELKDDFVKLKEELTRVRDDQERMEEAYGTDFAEMVTRINGEVRRRSDTERHLKTTFTKLKESQRQLQETRKELETRSQELQCERAAHQETKDGIQAAHVDIRKQAEDAAAESQRLEKELRICWAQLSVHLNIARRCPELAITPASPPAPKHFRHYMNKGES